MHFRLALIAVGTWLLFLPACSRHEAVIFRVVSADSGEPVPAAQISAHAMQMLDFFAPGQRSGWTDADGYWRGEIPRYRRTGIFVEAVGHLSVESGAADWTGPPPTLEFSTVGFGAPRLTSPVAPSFHPDGRPVYVVPLQSTDWPETAVVFPTGFRGFVLVATEPGPELADRPKPWAFTRHVNPNGTVVVPDWPQYSPLRALWNTGEEFPGFNFTAYGEVCVYGLIERGGPTALYIVGKGDDWLKAHRLLWLKPAQPGGPSRFDSGARDLLLAEIRRRETPLSLRDAERLIHRAKRERGLPLTETLTPAPSPCDPG